MSKRSGGLFKLLAGIGIGVGAGMLLAPKTGEELRKDLMKKINELKKDIEDLDKEKALDIAKTKSEELKVKANELLDLAKEKGTPVVEKAAEEVRTKAIQVTKEVLKKLEKEESK